MNTKVNSQKAEISTRPGASFPVTDNAGAGGDLAATDSGGRNNKMTEKLGSVANFEQETIINFNKDEPVAYIFTYENTWMKHIEQRLGIKPYEKNEHGARSYIVPRDRVRMPQPKKRVSLSKEKKQEIAARLKKGRLAKQLELV